MDTKTKKALAVGVDAGDRDFIARHLAVLPHMGRFFQESDVRPLRAEPLSGAVWSSFSTGKHPGGHGVYHHLQWNPVTMRMQRSHPNWIGKMTPFWRSLAKNGKRVAVLDVPFVFEGDSGGSLEINNWGSHDLVGPFWTSEKKETDRIRAEYGLHPMGFEVPVEKTAKKLSADRDQMIKGASLRSRLVRDLTGRRDWDLFIVVFGESHRAGHLLYPSTKNDSTVPSDGLLDVYKAIDRAIGEILEQTGDDCDVVLFALHGMGPNSSQCHLSLPMLEAAMRTLPDGDKAIAKSGLFRWLRKNVPAKLQHVVAEAVPVGVRDFVVAREIAGGVSSGSTKAMSLEGDLSGYWRLLMAGRESAGILSPAEFDVLKTKLAESFEKFTTEDGRPLVKEMHFPSSDLGGDRSHLLPDIVAEWHLDIAPQFTATHPHLETVHGQLATGRGGNHKFNGFYAHLGPRQGQGPAPTHISELGGLIEWLAR